MPTQADRPRLFLGIESSCDETAVALVASDGTVLADRVVSQLEDHAPYAGVVPEVAARAHLAHLSALVRDSVAEAGIGWAEIDGIAATAGPGLIGGVMIGLTTAKGLALALDRPLYGVNHLEGHALTARLTDGAAFPYLLLLVSGGHCQLILVEAVGRYRRLGTTIDDAVGEAFDKTAKRLGLGYPGGPAVERLAADGDPARFALPRPLVGRPGCHFSFSGLKTAVARLADGLAAPDGSLAYRDVADLCAGFQAAVADSLADRTGRALALLAGEGIQPTALVVAGGVAANRTLNRRLASVAETAGLAVIAPPLKWCTDNAVMIAWAALERVGAGGAADDLALRPRPRWPLDPTAEPALGAVAGKSGVKA